MTKRAYSQIVLIVLVLAAAALGWSQGARGAGSSSAIPLARLDAAPTVQAYTGLTRRGFPVYFAFRVQDDGPVTVRATVRFKSRLALRGTLNRDAPSWETRDIWKPKPISKALPAGRYTFCDVATDAAGNRARSCVPYRVL